VPAPTLKNYADQLFTTYLLPVQVVGFLLLIAMLGVIVLSKRSCRRRRNETGRVSGGRQMTAPRLSTTAYLFVSALLFAIGFFGVLLRKNTLVIYMCLELMLVASTLALVAFSRFNGTLDGNVFVFFILTVAAAEVAVGLAIIVALFRKRHTIQVDELNSLKN
jgi:NADH-quinone oxidoreductase subunit K